MQRLAARPCGESSSNTPNWQATCILIQSAYPSSSRNLDAFGILSCSYEACLQNRADLGKKKCVSVLLPEVPLPSFPTSGLTPWSRCRVFFLRAKGGHLRDLDYPQLLDLSLVLCCVRRKRWAGTFSQTPKEGMRQGFSPSLAQPPSLSTCRVYCSSSANPPSS